MQHVISNTISSFVWTVEEGLELCRKVEAKLAPLGAHAALGGGCMVKGYSHKDLDLFIYPHLLSEKKESVTKYIHALEYLGFENLFPVSWSPLKNTGDQKDVWSATWKGKRVDLFFLEFTK